MMKNVEEAFVMAGAIKEKDFTYRDLMTLAMPLVLEVWKLAPADKYTFGMKPFSRSPSMTRLYQCFNSLSGEVGHSEDERCLREKKPTSASVQRYRLDLDGTLLPEWCQGCDELFEWDELARSPVDWDVLLRCVPRRPGHRSDEFARRIADNRRRGRALIRGRNSCQPTAGRPGRFLPVRHALEETLGLTPHDSFEVLA